MNLLTLLFTAVVWYSCARHAACAYVSNEAKTSGIESGSSKVYPSVPLTDKDLKKFTGCDTQLPPKPLSQWDVYDWLTLARVFCEEKKGISFIEFNDFHNLSNLHKIKKVATEYDFSLKCESLRHPLLFEAACRVGALNGQDLTLIKNIILNGPKLDVSSVLEYGCLCLFNLLPEEWQVRHRLSMLSSMIRYRVFTDDEILDMFGKFKESTNDTNSYLRLTIRALEQDRVNVFNALLSHLSTSSEIDYKRALVNMSYNVPNAPFTESQLEMLDRFLEFVFRGNLTADNLPSVDDFMKKTKDNIKYCHESNIHHIHLREAYWRHVQHFVLVNSVVSID